MLSDVEIIDSQYAPLHCLVSECFGGYKIPEPVSGHRTLWVGHRFGEFVASAGAVTFEANRPKVATLHTACVHPDFRGHGFQRELIRWRMDYADREGKSVMLAHASCAASVANLRAEGFGREDDGFQLVYRLPLNTPYD